MLLFREIKRRLIALEGRVSNQNQTMVSMNKEIGFLRDTVYNLGQSNQDLIRIVRDLNTALEKLGAEPVLKPFNQEYRGQENVSMLAKEGNSTGDSGSIAK